jgi:hypothetical protein
MMSMWQVCSYNVGLSTLTVVRGRLMPSLNLCLLDPLLSLLLLSPFLA